MAFDNSRLLSQIKLKASLSDGRFTDQELLDLAYDELVSGLVPMIKALKEEYFVRSLERAITASQQKYDLPERALGEVLREIKIVQGGQLLDLPRISAEDVESEEVGTPESFFLEQNRVCLYPIPASTQNQLRMYYFMRPGRLVLTSDCAIITAIDGGTNSLTCTPPASWSISNSFDLVKGKAGFDTLSLDLSASSVTSTTVTLSSLPSGLAVGDYLTLSGESPIPQIPQECHQLLIQMTVSRVLENLNQLDSLQASEARVASLKQSVTSLLSGRVEGAAIRFTSQLV